MINRILAGLVLMLGLVSGLVAQEPSLVSEQTSGLVRNPYDAAFQIDESLPGPDFSTLDANYLVGGIDNINQTANVGVSATLNLGYFSLPNRWSIFNSLAITSLAPQTLSETNNIPETKLSAGDWISEADTFTYQTLLASSWNQIIAAAFRVQDLNLAVKLQLSINDDTDPLLNYTRVTNSYYDEQAANALVAPVQTLNQTINRTSKSLDAQTTFSVGLSGYLRPAEIGHYFGLGTSFYASDLSTASSVDYVAAPINGAAGSYTDSTASSNNIFYQTIFSPFWQIDLLPVGSTDKDNRFWVRLSPVFGFETIVREDGSSSAITNYGIDGINPLAGAAASSATSYVLESSGIFNLMLQTGQYLFFNIDQGFRVGFHPQASVSFFSELNGGILRTSSEVAKIDVDLNGDFTSAGDQTVTTNTTYTNYVINASGPLQARSTDYFVATLTLPVGATITPQGWPISFNVGTQGTFGLNTTVDTTLSSTRAQSVSTATVGGATTEATQNFGTEAATTVQYQWTVGFIHNFGVHIPIGPKSSLDISLNLNNLFTFDNLAFQFVFGLPPSGKAALTPIEEASLISSAAIPQ